MMKVNGTGNFVYMFVLTCLSLCVKLFQSKAPLAVEACVVRHTKNSFLFLFRFFFFFFFPFLADRCCSVMECFMRKRLFWEA